MGQLHLEDDVGSVHQTGQPLWDWNNIFDFFAHKYRLWVPAYIEANPPPGSAAEDVAGAMGSTDNPTVMTNLERGLNVSI